MNLSKAAGLVKVMAVRADDAVSQKAVNPKEVKQSHE